MLTRVAGFCCRVPESRLGWAFHWPAALSPPLNHIEPGIPCELAHSMKYGKTYSTLLSTSSWPQEWRDIALDYSALKKLLNAVVEELAAQGLNPAVLNELLDAEKEYEEHEAYLEQPLDETQPSSSGRPPTAVRSPSHRSRAQYEFTSDQDHITPQLRLWLYSQSDGSLPILSPAAHLHTEPTLEITEKPEDDSSAASAERDVDGVKGEKPTAVLMSSSVGLVNTSNPLYVLKSEYDRTTEGTAWIEEISSDADDAAQDKDGSSISSSPEFVPEPRQESSDSQDTQEVIIPLTADTAFHRLLANALNSLALLQSRTQTQISDQILALADTISSCSGPPSRSRKSDLYAWREIFQLWVECQIYRGGATERERTSGEGGIRNVAEAEKRLGMFASEVVKRGLGDRRTLKSARSREALETFLNLNVHILDLKKFQLANAEAARKILKKHQKRTALPIATSLSVLPISQSRAGDLPQVLITTLTETLLPILPSIDDYSCLICTSIAFKPIRLSCGHLFCVRCLVKMQKRGQADCPLCRTPCVLLANRDNLDVGLMNFMKEWFPVETKEKAKANERESAEEQLTEMGISPNGCVIM
ncbi:RING finger protein [Ceratobasidium sp. AG-Ba]|nr:RING finger protein [Ceratobasidium sp. AG-Ba]